MREMPLQLHLFVKEAAINLCGQKRILGQNRLRVVIDRCNSHFALASSHCDVVCFVFKPQLSCSCFLLLNCGLKKFRSPLLQWSIPQLPVTWNNANMVESAWMLRDDIPQDHLRCRGSAAPHSSDSWHWGLQSGTNPRPGLCAEHTAPVWASKWRAFQERPALTKAIPLWRKSWVVPAGVSGDCMHQTHASAAAVSEDGYPACPASFGAWLLLHLTKQDLNFLCETQHSYLFSTNNFESTGSRNLAGLGRK